MSGSQTADTLLTASSAVLHEDIEPDLGQGVDGGCLVVGISGARQNAAVAAAIDGRLQGFCEQERLTRIRSVGLKPAILPREALDAVLGSAGRSKTDVRAFVTAEASAALPADLPQVQLEHHYCHAATAVLTSPFCDAAVLICDENFSPPVSVWSFTHGRLMNQYWPWDGQGFASVYSECADLFGFGPSGEHRLEALARLDRGHESEKLAPSLSYRDGALRVDRAWKETIADWLSKFGGTSDVRKAAAVASAFQRCLGDTLVALISEIRSRLPHDQLCLGGGFFYNTYFNTRVVASELYDRVFVPLNPGNAGLAAGAALAVARQGSWAPNPPSPFLGPEYDQEQIKRTLDNCKLTYECLSESEVIESAVAALRRGALVGWFQGRMEWGHRSLGHRSILANPFSRHVLENLNAFLKQREHYRAYGLSVCEEEARRHFNVPAPSRFMELDYSPLEPDRFGWILPEGASTCRVQTIPDQPRLFRELHRAFGAATGTGVLVNTSFNGFHEPIVCSPRDAVRVFYGTGLDMVVLGRFLLRK